MTNRFTAVSMATLVLAAAAQTAGALQFGDAMPASTVQMKSVTGKEVTLGEAAGRKGTLVIFSCNHCPWVKAWEARIAALGNELPAKGIGVVAVNSNDPAAYPGDDYADMVARAKARGFTFPYVVDSTSDVARAFGATHTPEAFLFDGAGKLVYHGAIDDNAQDPAKVKHHYLADAADALLAGRPIAVTEAKAIGCSLMLRPKG
ncbi:MAG: thioredoxin family protein [Thermoanaerobaculaceae bacterium]|nr:thioredoxin family protein [Thermoanaerobaculaceae bacterium]TAM45167.1 MAG: thioredoxin family protein [Acidobacteriota bacterium]